MKGKKVVSSTVILETQAAWNLPSTVSTVPVVQLPCQLNQEQLRDLENMRDSSFCSVAIELCILFCDTELYSHVIL